MSKQVYHQATGSQPSTVSSQRGRSPSEDDTAHGANGRPQRGSAGRKVEVVLRLLRGESLDALARESDQPAWRISQWREDFLRGGEASMKGRAGDPAFDALAEEKRRLQAKLGEVLMEGELVRERIARMEQNRPLARRRSRR